MVKGGNGAMIGLREAIYSKVQKMVHSCLDNPFIDVCVAELLSTKQLVGELM